MDNRLNIEFNKQINQEFYSAYLYFAMSTYFLQNNLHGFAKYMKKQAHEELEHAQKIYDFLIIRNGKIILERIENPDNDFESPIDVFIKAYEHEKFITSKINELFSLSGESKDLSSTIFLQEFVMEQLEEENKFDYLVQKIKYAKENCACIIEELNAKFESM